MASLYSSVLKSIMCNRMQKITYPTFCTFLVTWRCNAKCIMCSIWKKSRQEELSVREIRQIFSRLKPMDAVRLSGGEPFLREDFPEIIDTIQETVSPHLIHITTNGFLTERITSLFNKIGRADNIHLKVSINSIGERQDRVMGVPGAYEKALKTLASLAEIRDKYKFYLGINQTVTDERGYREYVQLKEIGEKWGLYPHVSFAYKDVDLYGTTVREGDELDGDVDFDPFFDMDPRRMEEFLKLILTDSRRFDDFMEALVKQYFIHGFRKRFLEGKKLNGPTCVALSNHLRILPDGNVPVCLYYSNVVGNLRDEPFERFWFGERIRKFRRQARLCPGCWVDCEVVPSAIYTGHIIKSLFKALI